MVTLKELARLRTEIAEAEKTKADAIASHLNELKGRPVSELIGLKQYWENEQKKYRTLDLASSQKRREAGFWLESIERLLTSGIGPKKSENVPTANPNNMSVEDAAVYLGISVSTLYKMTSQNRVPFHKVGKKKLGFSKTELDEYFAKQSTLTDEDVNDQAERYISNERPGRDRKKPK
jgi:excisionase family DNA binding protein